MAHSAPMTAVLATAADGDNLSCVVHAMMSGNVESARFLLEKGALPNTVDGMGMTPLHHSMFMGDPAVVRMLVKFGADPSLKDGEDKSVLERAADKPELLKALERQPGDGDLSPAVDKAAMQKLIEQHGLSEKDLDKVKDAACSGNTKALGELLQR
mmetsp:Transcript_104131/g.212460  ORF Transcript_104131/g.212460 Transcript_104131/m.212460 type:complete len:156 (-) Transcript_104131:55-522(-)